MQCPKCSGSMTEGFVADATYGAIGVSGWVEGAPNRSVWTGLDLRGKRRAEIVTWRCNRCGFLEHYAPTEVAAGRKSMEGAHAALVLALVAAGILAVIAVIMVAR